MIFFSFSIGLVKQFFSVIDGRIGQCVVPLNMWAISPRVLFVQLDDMATGTLRVVFLVNFVVRAAESRDLGADG